MLAQQKQEIIALFQAALAPVLAGTSLEPSVVLERPRDASHGDVACNIAMQLAKQLKQNPLLWKEMIVKTQTPTMLEAFNILADYQLDNALYFFRSRIEDAFSSKSYCGQTTYDRSRRGKNDSIFERLDVTFSFEQALQQSIAVKGANVTREVVRQMLKNWKRQGLIGVLPDMRYQKVQPAV